MAIKIRDSSRTLSGKFGAYIKSQYKFLPPVHARAIDGLLTVIKPKDNKHRHNSKYQSILSNNGDLGHKQYYHSDITDNVVVPHATMVHSNGANAMGRVVYTDNTRIVYSPLREFNEASKRAQTMAKASDIAKQLQRIRNDSNGFCSYMTTLTIPNCNKNELN